MPLGMRLTALRDSDLRWLLRLTWAGREYRLAEEPVSAPTGEAGASEWYEGGLEIGDYRDALDLWADDSAPRSVSLSFYMPDVITRISAGADLQTARGQLYLWADGGDERDLVLLLDGVLREPEYGAATEPISATLDEEEIEGAGRIPDEGARYTATTWPGGTGDVEQYDERYPIIIGRPGGGVASGSPSLTVSSGRLLICGEPVVAASAEVYDEEHDTTETLPVTLYEDGAGRMTSTLTGFTAVGDPPGTLVVGDPYWIRWTGAGGVLRGTSEVRGAGSVLRWLLERSGLRYDAGRVQAAVPALDGYQIDAAIVATPEERVRPLDWIRDHLLPILPISLRIGAAGLCPVVWRWEATEAEAEIDVDGGRADRDGPIAYSSRDDVANELILRYRRDACRDRYTLRAGLTGDRASTDSDLARHLWCEVSRLRYGSRPLESTSDVISEPATASRVLAWWARRYALPLRSGTWRVDRALARLEPSAVVRVRDSEVGLDGLGLVQSVTWASGRETRLTVTLLERVEGEP